MGIVHSYDLLAGTCGEARATGILAHAKHRRQQALQLPGHRDSQFHTLKGWYINKGVVKARNRCRRGSLTQPHDATRKTLRLRCSFDTALAALMTSLMYTNSTKAVHLVFFSLGRLCNATARLHHVQSVHLGGSQHSLAAPCNNARAIQFSITFNTQGRALGSAFQHPAAARSRRRVGMLG